MSEFGGLWKHENNQHALVPPNVAAQVVEELKPVTYATPPIIYMEERRKKRKTNIFSTLHLELWSHGPLL